MWFFWSLIIKQVFPLTTSGSPVFGWMGVMLYLEWVLSFSLSNFLSQEIYFIYSLPLLFLTWEEIISFIAEPEQLLQD